MVGEVIVNYTPEVVSYLDDLVKILYKKEYFGFLESAENYVSEIYDFVPHNLKHGHKSTPIELKHLGSQYIFYKANSRTLWYIFFESQETRYLITGIINSHCEEAKYL